MEMKTLMRYEWFYQAIQFKDFLMSEILFMLYWINK